jgi:hypothetical protein
VKFSAGRLVLDLPANLTRDEAVAWNLSFEKGSGVVVSPEGYATYTGFLCERLSALSPSIANGFHVRDIADACRAMSDLRSRLQTLSS